MSTFTASVVIFWTVIVLNYALPRIYRFLYTKKKAYRLPPRVPGGLIFGNSFQIPSDPVERGPWARELALKYGEM
jgi:hypothetical protein